MDEPLWLLLFVPAAIYLLWTGWNRMNKGSKLFRASFALRVVSVSILILAMASPAIHQPVEEEQIIFLWDRSDSMAEADAGIEEQLTLVLPEKEIHQSI